MKKSVKEARAGLIPESDWDEKEANHKMHVEISVREWDTILAALRFWQVAADQESAGSVEIDGEQYDSICAIAREHGSHLLCGEIDKLCERINGSPEPVEPIIFVEGGIVQDVIYPTPDAETGQPYTPLKYDLVDYDVLEGSSDEEIADYFTNRSDTTQKYMKKHLPAEYKKFADAIRRHKRTQSRIAKLMKPAKNKQAKP